MNKKTTPANPTPHIWSKDALLTKAQRYANEMTQYDKDDWRFGLWASFTLEALGRAALANVSPALLADTPKESWNSLYYALGGAPKASKFIPKSIEISIVFSRLAEILPNFDTRLTGICAQQISRRNEDLHSGGMPFDNVAPSNWLPLFYEACSVLLSSMGSNLENLVGIAAARAANEMIAAAKDDSAKAVAASISAHKTVWGNKSKTEQGLLITQSSVWATKHTGHRVNCPSCDCVSLVNGSPTAAPVIKLERGLIIERQEHLPSRFECVACGLKISGLPQLHVCGLGSPYTATFTYDPIDYYREDTTASDWEPDNNE